MFVLLVCTQRYLKLYMFVTIVIVKMSQSVLFHISVHLTLTYLADVDFTEIMIRFCEVSFMQGGMSLWCNSTLERFGQTDHKSRVGKNYSQKTCTRLG